MLFSGGQDSTVCLAWALERFARVETVGFDYGQRHAVELGAPRDPRADRRARAEWAGRLGDDHVIELDALAAMSDTALTRDMAIEMGEKRPAHHLRARPQSDLPRLCRRAGLPARRQALVAGMCETDYSGYPDCRDDTIKAMQVALTLGMDRRFVVHTPLMWIDKAGTFAHGARDRRHAAARSGGRGDP